MNKFVYKKLYLMESMLLEYLIEHKDNAEIREIYNVALSSPEQIEEITKSRRAIYERQSNKDFQ